MRFLTRLLATKPPKALHVSDIALLASLLPHLGLLKPMMLLYLAVALLLLWRMGTLRNAHLLYMALFGGVALALSFFDSFTFVGLSRLGIFVSLVVSLLIVAVVLQRLSGVLNFYLALSPLLFLAMSYFFYHSIAMLLYALFCLLLFLALLLWHRMQSPLIDALKTALSMALFSLPTIVLLFLIFPRISFETKDFGFKTVSTIRSGHDGLMHLGHEALMVPSSRVVMELFFTQGIPKEEQLYIRGSSLYHDRTTRWEPLGTPPPTRFAVCPKSAERYQVTLYPHRKRWLYALDHPCEAPKKATLDHDAILRAKEEVTTIVRYEGASILSHVLAQEALSPALREAALHYDAQRDEQLYAYTQDLASIADPHQKLAALTERFRALNLHYSLAPQAIDPRDPIDGFLFGANKGYCVHFASAFATMARMSGLPSRVITGFKANAANAFENYLVVRENDAHAWVEVYLEAQGWQRVETTAFAQTASIQSVAEASQAQSRQGFWAKIELGYMYVRYRIQSWVLDYNRSKQMELLRLLLEDAIALAGALLSLGALVLLGYLGRLIGTDARREHRAKKLLRPLLKRLERQGLRRLAHESVESFLRRCDQKGMSEVIEAYNRARYGRDPSALGQLQEALERLNER
ncbi:MAG: DUF3488 domain-containing protein [Campylobacterales bacterium]|nr:DUF3488 domain-containing protein [Campylobacterales bacterium]